jgi:hypothetical protein
MTRLAYTRPRMRPERSTLVGIALVCFANLLLSILVTRLFSATMFYHFTFMAVGLAMFGIAASGVYVFLNKEKFAQGLHEHLARNARWFAVTTVISLLNTIAHPIFGGQGVPDWSLRVFWQLVILIVVTALPFYFAGVVVSLALTFYRDHVSRVYFYDLVGAALAALTAGIVLGLLGGTSAVLFVGVLALVAAALFQRTSGIGRWVVPALAAAFVVFNIFKPIIRLGPMKWEEVIKLEKWTTFSRITVGRGPNGYLINIDAGATTDIVDLRKATPNMHKPEITALALSTWDRPPDDVLVIGPGGGRDVMFALVAGAKKVTGVEINPVIADRIMRDRYLERSGYLYTDPRVEIVVDEGRSFISRTDKKFDMIQASLVDTWAATAAGAFALTENTLYTIEAFQDYYAHLTDRGVVTMTRFYGQIDGAGVSESERLVILAAGALELNGVKPGQTRKHMYFAATDTRLGTLIVKKTPFTPDEVARLDELVKTNGFHTIFSPTTNGQHLLEQYIDTGAWSDKVRSMKDELTPPTDDRPFFFFFTKFGDLFKVEGKKMYDPSLWVLVSLGTVLTLGLLFIILPLIVALVRGQASAPGESRRSQASVLGYFGVVGFAFMAVEIALLQRFTLFLGHPTYSLVVILFVVLLSTAIGARLADRFEVKRLGKVMLYAGLALGVLSAIYGLVLGDLLRAMIGLPRVARIIITGVLAAPCGLLMGTMVPSVVRVLAASKSPLVPWGWGVNGATSVIGTSIATIVAMYVGFTATFFVGAVCYMLAGAAGFLVARSYADR